MLKLADNPPILPPWVESLRELSGRWWVAHTKARNEKAFAWDLHHRRIGYFLPLYEKLIISGGRRRRILMPVFSSYVFLCGDDEARYTAMTTHRLCQTIEVTDQEQLIRELSSFERVLSQDAPLKPLPTIAVGRLCRITSGPFRGFEGPVMRTGSACRIFLKVTILGQGALLEIDARLLEPID